MALKFANNAGSNLAGAITNTATSCNLAPGTGILFPVLGTGDFFKLTFIDAATGNLREIVHVTGMSGDTVTSMIRGQENTNPLNWLAGDLARNLLTAGSMGTLVQQITYQPTRIVTFSGVFTMTSSDYAIGLQRFAALANSSTNLPPDTAPSQGYEFSDLAGNFQAFPVTIFPPPGHNIANETSVVLNVNRQTCRVLYYGSNTWSVKF